MKWDVAGARSPEHALRSAEHELHELALELRRVPVDESSGKVHVRALELKRELATRACFDEHAVQAAREEILRLRAEAIRLRRALLTGRQAHAASLSPAA